MNRGRTAKRAGSVLNPIANRYPGQCEYCGGELEAGEGLAYRHPQRGVWVVRHHPQTWHGSPVSGKYIGGCPKRATVDSENGGES